MLWTTEYRRKERKTVWMKCRIEYNANNIDAIFFSLCPHHFLFLIPHRTLIVLNLSVKHFESIKSNKHWIYVQSSTQLAYLLQYNKFMCEMNHLKRNDLCTIETTFSSSGRNSSRYGANQASWKINREKIIQKKKDTHHWLRSISISLNGRCECERLAHSLYQQIDIHLVHNNYPFRDDANE